MTGNEFVTRVMAETVVAVAALSLFAAGLFGSAAAVGVASGGGLAVLNFRWLSTRIAGVAAGGHAGVWLSGLALRFLAVAAACAVVLVSGAAHPLGVIAGLTVLPFMLIVRGLSAARTE